MLSFMCATPIGSAAAGPIFELIGYPGTFGLSAACNLVAFLYALFFIRETVKSDYIVSNIASNIVSNISKILSKIAMPKLVPAFIFLPCNGFC